MIAEILDKPNICVDFRKKVDALDSQIGNTPMIELLYSFRCTVGRIYIKCENFNLTGSIKDRMTLFTIKKAYEEGKIEPGDHIVETTSGNTGISLAVIGKELGHPVKLMTPDWLNQEYIDAIRETGALIDFISEEEGGFLGSIEIGELLAEKALNVFLPNQFKNKTNPEAYESTVAPEIWQQLTNEKIIPHAFVSGIGTGGTIMGIGRFLRNKDASIKIHPLKPIGANCLTEKERSTTHKIHGLVADFVKDIVNLQELDEMIPVKDGDAILMAQKLLTQLGLAVGISSGANVIAAIKLQQALGEHANVVTVFPDSNKNYSKQHLMPEEIGNAEYQSSEIQLLEYKLIGQLKL